MVGKWVDGLVGGCHFKNIRPDALNTPSNLRQSFQDLGQKHFFLNSIVEKINIHVFRKCSLNIPPLVKNHFFDEGGVFKPNSTVTYIWGLW